MAKVETGIFKKLAKDIKHGISSHSMEFIVEKFCNDRSLDKSFLKEKKHFGEDIYYDFFAFFLFSLKKSKKLRDDRSITVKVLEYLYTNNFINYDLTSPKAAPKNMMTSFSMDSGSHFPSSYLLVDLLFDPYTNGFFDASLDNIFHKILRKFAGKPHVFRLGNPWMFGASWEESLYPRMFDHGIRPQVHLSYLSGNNYESINFLYNSCFKNFGAKELRLFLKSVEKIYSHEGYYQTDYMEMRKALIAKAQSTINGKKFLENCQE